MAGGADFGIALKGDKALAKMFKRLPGTLQKRVGRKALRAGAKLILAAAKRNELQITNPTTPTATMEDIARGLKVRATRRSTRFIGVTVGTAADDGTAGHIELGTVNAPPNSFLRVAAIENEGRVIGLIADHVGKGIAEEARKARD